MIDFRYHLISIVAVLLALSVGVVLGSGILGEPLLDDIKSNVSSLEDRLDERRAEIADLNTRATQDRQFAEEATPYLLERSLEGAEVVVIEIDGVDGGAVRDMREAVGQAGGTVVSRIEINERVVLEDQTDRDSLALTLGSLIGGDADELRADLARVLGGALAAASTDGRSGGSSATAAVAGLDALLEQLVEDEYITLEQEAEGRAVPLGSSFIVIGGAPEPATYDVAAFVTELSRALASRGASLIVTETGDTVWDLVLSILNDGEAREQVATASDVDGVIGRVAAVMGLARVIEGEPTHLGGGSGADSIIPAPTVAP